MLDPIISYYNIPLRSTYTGFNYPVHRESMNTNSHELPQDGDINDINVRYLHLYPHWTVGAIPIVDQPDPNRGHQFPGIPRVGRVPPACVMISQWAAPGTVAEHQRKYWGNGELWGFWMILDDFGVFKHWSLWFNLQSGFLIFFGRVLKSFNWLRGREGGYVVQSISKSCGMLSWLWQEGLSGWVNPFWQLFVLCHSVLSSIL